MKYVMHLKYDGDPVNGFATQPHQNTIEDKINIVLKQIFSEPIKITGSARTDAKVHALDQVVMFESNKKLDLYRLKFSVNQLSPHYVNCEKIYIASDDFHVRYDMQSKTYMYKITKKYDPFLRRYSYNHRSKIDLDLIRNQLSMIEGTHDFKSFCSAKASNKSYVRTIFYTKVEEKGNEINIYINGDGFLYNMVRIIIGTLLDINDHKITLNMSEIITFKDRTKAGKTAPPQGLYLYKSNY